MVRWGVSKGEWDIMKRVLYWIGLLMIAGLVLMPDVRISPLESDSQVLAQDSEGQNASEQQYEILVPPELISSGCRLTRTMPDGSKWYKCSKDASPYPAGWEEESCHLIVDPNGVQSAVCEALASIAEPPADPPTQRCRLLRVDPDDTDVSECGNLILYKYPDGSMAMMSQ